MAEDGLIVCWGEVLWDLFPDGPRLGGAPANVAYHLAKLGRPVALVSRVGDDDLGRRALASMRAGGIDVDPVQVDPDRPTGRVNVTLQGGEPSYDLVEGCAWEAIELDSAAEALLPRAAAVCYGTLSQRAPQGRRSLERALAATPQGCLKVCDPNLRPKYLDDDLLRASLGHADVVKVNDKEADLLAERFGVEDAIRWLLEEQGVRLVAVTRGDRGSLLYSKKGRHDHPGVAADPGGDLVGAGDSFLSVLIHMALRDAPLAATNAAANRYAGFVASRQGATPEIPQELLDELGI